MDNVMAAALAAALGTGAVTGMLLIPAEIWRVRRIASLGGVPSRLPADGSVLTSTRSGCFRRAMTRVSAYLTERDEGLVSAAGLSAPATAMYRQWRPLLPAVAGLAVTALRWGRSDSLTYLFGAIAVAILAPEMVLRIVVSRRRAAVIREFPEVVDLLAVAAAGGSSLAGALRAVTGDATGPLSQEVRLAVREAAAGAPLQLALRHLAQRVGLPAVSAFVGSLCEAESLGVPLADNLAVQSESARTAYRQQVEGKLSQLPLQMTICALVFLFPTAFIVVALPNIIAFTRGLW